MTQLAKQLMAVFKTRPDTYAEQRKDGSYMRVPHPLTLDDIEAHLKGLRTLGLYVIDSPARDTCSFCAIDIDTRDEKLFDDIYAAMDRLHVSPYAVCEDSGNKGRHIFIFFAEPVKAAIARQLLKAVLKEAQAPHNIEIFPKQDRLRADGFGSLIKLPLGVHKKSGRRSYFFANNFDTPVEPMKLLRHVPSMFAATLSEVTNATKHLWEAPPLPTSAAAGKALKGMPPCIKTILEGVSEGARDSCLFNLAVYFLKLKKLSPSKALDAVLAWNEKNSPPLSSGFVQYKVNYVAGSGYDRLSCRMDEMQEFCSSDCVLKGRK